MPETTPTGRPQGLTSTQEERPPYPFPPPADAKEWTCPQCGFDALWCAHSGAAREKVYDSPLDPGITREVHALAAGGIETFESCEGGPGHAFPEPTVRFHGDSAEGYRALAVALQSGLRVLELRRTWPVIDGALTGPYWELTFRS